MTDADINELVKRWAACRDDEAFKNVLSALDSTLRSVARMGAIQQREDLHAALITALWRWWLPHYHVGSEVPARLYVRYCARLYASTWLSRYRHGECGELLNGAMHNTQGRAADADVAELYSLCLARMSRTQRRALALHINGHSLDGVARAMRCTRRRAALYLRRARIAALATLEAAGEIRNAKDRCSKSGLK